MTLTRESLIVHKEKGQLDRPAEEDAARVEPDLFLLGGINTEDEA